MKIIDLLNKIANGEEVPKKIKYPNKEKEYIYDLNIQDYRCDDTLIFNTLFSKYRTNFFINDEVEIIEENKKIEKLELVSNGCENSYALLNEYGKKCGLTKSSKIMCNKINEIIDYLMENK